MSNTWFQFREFRVEQDSCAMKVTTDACIQGAWTPLPLQAKRLLDIGTGTGLLSLMMAQRSLGLVVDAVEFDADAAKQAAGNVCNSLWRNRISVFQKDIRAYSASATYDVIICNPPFFASSLLAKAHTKNLARHDVSLKKEELLYVASRLLSAEGWLSLLLPYTEYLDWQDEIKAHDFHEVQSLHIRHRPGAAVKRVVCILSKNAPIKQCEPFSLTIQNAENGYSADFIKLLKPFYLNLTS